jgi:hypothetical protein
MGVQRGGRQLSSSIWRRLSMATSRRSAPCCTAWGLSGTCKFPYASKFKIYVTVIQGFLRLQVQDPETIPSVSSFGAGSCRRTQSFIGGTHSPSGKLSYAQPRITRVIPSLILSCSGIIAQAASQPCKTADSIASGDIELPDRQQ